MTHDTIEHAHFQEKFTPEVLEELRRELQHPAHFAICEYASKGNDFEDSIGRIALKLDIAMDGTYHPLDAMALCLTGLRAKRMGGLWAKVLTDVTVPVELVEREGTVTLEKQYENIVESKPQNWTTLYTENKTYAVFSGKAHRYNVLVPLNEDRPMLFIGQLTTENTVQHLQIQEINGSYQIVQILEDWESLGVRVLTIHSIGSSVPTEVL